MDKKQIFFKELFKVISVVIIGLGIIFPLVQSFLNGFKYGLIQTYVKLFENTTQFSLALLVLVILLITAKRTWQAINIEKAKNKKPVKDPVD
ncbi:MAG: hypothetical protein HRU28_15400 [Rhizobiales bacterium]|nr:hypothetical protein [Hyphomicrobiales bacterium]